MGEQSWAALHFSGGNPYWPSFAPCLQNQRCWLTTCLICRAADARAST